MQLARRIEGIGAHRRLLLRLTVACNALRPIDALCLCVLPQRRRELRRKIVAQRKVIPAVAQRISRRIAGLHLRGQHTVRGLVLQKQQPLRTRRESIRGIIGRFLRSLHLLLLRGAGRKQQKRSEKQSKERNAFFRHNNSPST